MWPQVEAAFQPTRSAVVCAASEHDGSNQAGGHDGSRTAHPVMSDLGGFLFFFSRSWPALIKVLQRQSRRGADQSAPVALEAAEGTPRDT